MYEPCNEAKLLFNINGDYNMGCLWENNECIDKCDTFIFIFIYLIILIRPILCMDYTKEDECDGHDSSTGLHCFWKGGNDRCIDSTSLNICSDINSNTQERRFPDVINACDDAKSYYNVMGVYDEGCKWSGETCIDAPPYDCTSAHSSFSSSEYIENCKSDVNHHCYWNGRETSLLLKKYHIYSFFFFFFIDPNIGRCDNIFLIRTCNDIKDSTECDNNNYRNERFPSFKNNISCFWNGNSNSFLFFIFIIIIFIIIRTIINRQV
jgi:hypothetical protein